MKFYQSTLKQSITLNGIGVHRAKSCSITLNPAPVGYGIVFKRIDEHGKVHSFPAHANMTGATSYSTALGTGLIQVETIEHLMAAISAYSLDNLDIEVTSNEMPILDGGSFQYCQAFDNAGIVEQDAVRQYMVIEKLVRVESDKGLQDGYAEFLPLNGCQFDVSIDFITPAIGSQQMIFDMSAGDQSAINFRDEISKARTFGFFKDADYLKSLGMAMGSSIENSIVIGLDDKVMNPEGLIYQNEFVRHKLLDSIGDTALLGYPFMGLFRSYRGGHGLNAKLVKTLLEQPTNYKIKGLNEINGV